MSQRTESEPRAQGLWWLPLLAGLLPLVATVVAFQLSLRFGTIEGCNPFVDGCVSISRAARYGLANILFRAIMLPAAALQALTWLLCMPWLQAIGAGGSRLERALPWVGVAGALFLVLYGTFLGTEGEGYRWMRRYGVVFYFGCTGIGMLVVTGALQRHLRDGRQQRRVGLAMLGLVSLLPLLGLVYALLPLLLPAAPGSRDAVQNATEWWAATIFTVFFFVLAWAWRTTGFTARFGSRWLR